VFIVRLGRGGCRGVGGLHEERQRHDMKFEEQRWLIAELIMNCFYRLTIIGFPPFYSYSGCIGSH